MKIVGTPLLLMFSYVVTLGLAPVLGEVEELFIAFWSQWCESQPENASDFVILLRGLSNMSLKRVES